MCDIVQNSTAKWLQMIKQTKLEIVNGLRWMYNVQHTLYIVHNVKWDRIAIYCLEASPDRMTFANKVFHKRNETTRTR